VRPDKRNVRKLTRREKILSRIIDRLDNWREEISMREWDKHQAKHGKPTTYNPEVEK